MRKINFCLFLISILFLVSCDKRQINPYNSLLLLRDPGGCVYMITLSKSNTGTVTTGISEDYYKEEFTKLDTILSKENFVIKNSDSLKSIVKMIDEISLNTLKEGNTLVAPRRLEFFINNEKKIDSYDGWRDPQLRFLLKNFNPWINTNFFEPCR